MLRRPPRSPLFPYPPLSRSDTRRELWPDETRVRVERLNLDAASFRQLQRTHDADGDRIRKAVLGIVADRGKMQNRSEEHTSELQSRQYLVCRLLLEKKKKSK